MTFGASFGRVMRPPFGPATASGVVPWYLSGGIASSDCIAAYQPKGAASLAASYSNLNNPGTNDAAASGGTPDWATGDGWKGAMSAATVNSASIAYSQAATFIIKYTVSDTWWQFGTTAASKYLYISPQASTTLWFGIGNKEKQSSAVTSSLSGVACLAGRYGYYDGNLVATADVPTSFTNTVALTIFRPWHTAARVVAVGLYSITLSSTQVAAVTTAINLL
jgi:hypothetical protein